MRSGSELPVFLLGSGAPTHGLTMLAHHQRANPISQPPVILTTRCSAPCCDSMLPATPHARLSLTCPWCGKGGHGNETTTMNAVVGLVHGQSRAGGRPILGGMDSALNASASWLHPEVVSCPASIVAVLSYLLATRDMPVLLLMPITHPLLD